MGARATPSRGAVVVTGASSGIGRAVALRVARGGYRVLAGVRAAPDGERLRAELPGVEPVTLDVTDEGHLGDLVALVERTEPGGLSGLVNNAGIVVVGPVEGLSVAQWRAQLEVNVLGAVAATTALLPSLLRGRGRVVNISSAAGRVALPLFGPYAASKFALEAFSDSLRREVGPHGVRVTVVQPGVVATPAFAKTLPVAEAGFAALAPDVADRYRRQIASTRRGALQGPARGLAPQAVAAVVERALTAPRPRARYVIGRDARAAALVARVAPDRLLDAVLGALAS